MDWQRMGRIWKTQQHRERSAAVVAAVVGLSLSLGLFALVQTNERERLKLALDYRADELAVALKTRLEDRLATTAAIASFFHAIERPERARFNRFVQPWLERYPDLYALSWVLRIPREARTAIEQQLANQWGRPVGIYWRDAQRRPFPAPAQREYWALAYVQPPALAAAAGLDLRSIPSRRIALERAATTGNLAVSERVQLVGNRTLSSGQELANPFVIIAVLPIQRPIPSLGPGTPEQLRGFVQVVFSLEGSMRSVLAIQPERNVDLYLYDRSAPANNQFLLAYRSASNQIQFDPPPVSTSALVQQGLAERLCQPEGRCSRPLSVGDRQWELWVVPQASFAELADEVLAWWVLGGGGGLTAALVLYLVQAARQAERMAQLAQERQAKSTALAQALADLQATQAQLIQAEKMSSLGQLTAGIAHEINNPVSFIHGNLGHLSEYLEDLLTIARSTARFLAERAAGGPQVMQQAAELADHLAEVDLEFVSEDAPKLLSSMRHGTERIRAIVRSLRTFSRLDEAGRKAFDLIESLEATATIVQGQLAAVPGRPAIALQRHYAEDLPKILGVPAEINQALAALVMNAIEAIERRMAKELAAGEDVQPGRIELRVAGPLPCLADNGLAVVVSIVDNGLGLATGDRDRIFEPFFTTKPVGQGQGLGLTLAYRVVVEQHGGQLWAESRPEGGTLFAIALPLEEARDKTPPHTSGSGHRPTDPRTGTRQ